MAHAKRVISRITPTSDSVYFNDAGLSHALEMRNSALTIYICAAKKKKYQAPFIIFRQRREIDYVRAHVGTAEIRDYETIIQQNQDK